MTSRKLITTAVIATAIIALSGVVYYGSWDSGDAITPSSIAHSASNVFLPNPAFAQLGTTSTIADVAEETIDSIVNVAVSSRVQVQQGSPFLEDPFRWFFGPNPDQQQAPQQQQPQERLQQGLGSGVIVNREGVIITNNHVVEDADKVTVTLHDGREFDAEVLGTDPETDVAVIKLTGNVTGLKPIRLGDSDVLRLGDVVLAIGNPFGLSGTVTMGIVSAKGRGTRDIQLGNISFADFIQTDAAINPGNSGGALINLKGELVGLNTAIASQTGNYAGVGFAIPVNMVRPVMDQLLATGKVVRGYLGVRIDNFTKEMAEAEDLDIDEGALVVEVTPGTPAQEAGMQNGDVITAVNGQHVATSTDLMNTIAAMKPDTTVRLSIIRDKRESTVNVTLGERPGVDEMASAAGPGGPRGQGRSNTVDGLGVANIDRNTRQQYQIPTDITGVLVTSVQPGSSADEAGITVGTVIRGVGLDNMIDSVSAFRDAYNEAGDRVLLYIWQQGGHRYVTISKE